MITFAINSVDLTEFVLAGIILVTEVSSPFVFIIANEIKPKEFASLTACASYTPSTTNNTSGTLFISFNHLNALSNFSNSSIFAAASFFVKISKAPDSESFKSFK